MKKVKVYLNTEYSLDEKYRRFIELLMNVSDLEEWQIADRKDVWREYEVFEERKYVIECELSDTEIKELSDNFIETQIL